MSFNQNDLKKRKKEKNLWYCLLCMHFNHVEHVVNTLTHAPHRKKNQITLEKVATKKWSERERERAGERME